jgi:hypothetical protein
MLLEILKSAVEIQNFYLLCLLVLFSLDLATFLLL